MILDTNALSAFFDDESLVVQRLEGADAIHLPVVVLGEYRFGLLGSRRRRERELTLAELVRLAVVLAITESTTRHYAEIRHELKRAATPIPANDAWIAALAREHGLPVMSSDAHFDAVPGVRRIGW